MSKRDYRKRILAFLIAVVMLLAESVTALANPAPDISRVTDSAGPSSEQTDSGDDESVSSDRSENSDDEDASGTGADNDETSGGDVADAQAGGASAEDDADDDLTELTDESIECSATAAGDASDLSDNDELLDGYLTRQFEEQMIENGVADDEVFRNRFNSSVPRGDSLTGNNKKVYNQLKTLITNVAAGNVTTVTVNIPLTDSDKKLYSASELGVSTVVTGNNTVPNDAYNALVYKFADLSKVKDALVADYPYELFWYDKVQGYRYSSNLSFNNTKTKVGLTSLTIKMCVSYEYAQGSCIGSNLADTATIKGINQTVTRANQVVQDAAENAASDYDKLIYYRNWICKNVAYNTVAGSSSSIPYGNPWQLIWAFDNKPDTTIVCEGYSKAFKWLFDLTDFDSDLMECYLVTGTTSGPHMWNTVRMDDGIYYIADLTNCDADNGNLIFSKFFLGGYTRKASGKYTYYAREDYPGGYSYMEVSYTYDSETYRLYTNGELDVSGTDYDPKSVQPPVKYTVSFDPNGHGTAPAPKRVKEGGRVTKPTDPSETGYDFGGWYKEAACRNVWNFDNDKVTEDTILYAKWTAKDVSLTYYANGGTGSMTPASGKFGSEVTVASCGFSRTGYHFIKWNTKNNGTGTSYDPGDKYTMGITGNDLYAVWEKNVYDVDFSPTGGSFVASQRVEHGGKATKPSPDPTKEGYDFAGWYKQAACETAWDFQKDVIKNATTIYAKWTPKKYTVAFATSGGSDVADQTVEYNKYAKRPAADPTKAGHTFTGWYKDAGNNTPWAFESDVITGPTTIYAGWKINSYVVSFNTGGGTSVSSQTVKYDSRASRPSTDPKREEFDFAGWYKNAGYKENWDFDVDVVKDNTVIYAKWVRRFTGWKKDENGVWKYIENGIEVKNRFVTAGGSTYYLKDDGSRAVGKTVLTLNGEKTFYFNRKGVMQTGWISDGTGKHYYDPANGGAMAVSKWTGEGKNRVYVDEDGNRHVAGSANIDDNEYYFDSNGQVKTGWIKVSDKWYYFNPAEDNYGAKIKAEAGAGAQQFIIGGKTYLVNESGERLTGWQGDKYYDANGVLITGWKKIDGDWYYFYPDDTSKDGEGGYERGDKATGLVVVDGKLYSFGTDGKRAGGGETVQVTTKGSDGNTTIKEAKTNHSGVVKTEDEGFVNTSSGDIYVASGGKAVTDAWITQGNTQVRIGHDGKVQSGTVKIEGKLYGLDENGSVTLNGWYKYDGPTKKLIAASETDSEAIFVNPDGTVRTGWVSNGTKSSYYDDEGKRVTNAVAKIGKKLYGFNENGELLTAGTYSVDQSTRKIVPVSASDATYRVNPDGTLVTGWYKPEGSDAQYYFSTENGAKLTEVHKIGAERYYFDRVSGELKTESGWTADRRYYITEKGVVRTGWFEDGGSKYYLGKDGERRDGVIKAGTKLYYQTADGIVTADNAPPEKISERGSNKIVLLIEGESVYIAVNAKGVLQTGWQTIGGSRYYFDKATGYALTGTQQVRGIWYTFDSGGKQT